MKASVLTLSFNLFLVLGVTCALPACTTLSEVRPEFINTPEERAFQNISTQYKSGHFTESVAAAEEFEKTYPFSLKLQKARFQKAQAEEELHLYPEATETYLAIANFSKKSQPEIAALSLYRLSFVYEAIGDNQRVLTSLFDAQRMEQYLPAEISQAEIPARLAMAYMKENNAEESARWLAEADAGLKRALDVQKDRGYSKRESDEWYAQTYYNMGSVTISEVNDDNVQSVIQGQRTIQKYLIKSLQYNDPVWSAKASRQLRGTYDTLWKAIQKLPEAPTYEKFKTAGEFAEVIDEALLFQPAAEQISNPYQTEVFGALRSLKLQVEDLLRSPVYTPLIRKSDKASPKRPLPATILKSEDPN